MFYLLISLAFVLVHSYQYTADLPVGPYCERRGCCDGRLDQCSSPILDTLCYCDEFCNRTHSDDCCPDYLSHCLGIIPAPEPVKTCFYDGQYFYKGKVAKENCKTCKCEEVNGRMEMLCDDTKCIIESEIINTVNQMSNTFGWQAKNYSEFWGRPLSDGITLRLGTLQPHTYVRRMHPVRRLYDLNKLPKEFDAEQAWPGKISGIADQGWCGSSWAISTAAVASDRFAVLSKGIETPKLSAQHLVSCDRRGQQSCAGGYLDKAWNYIRKFGIVDEPCFPYVGTNEKCHIPRKANLLTARCPPTTSPLVDRKDFYRVAPAYRLRNETDIMYEITQSGPVQATMKIFHDFFMYSSGIYKHTDLTNSDRTGYHSVRIVGWGEEYSYNGITKYWKVANSWGHQWGENGYFRILRGSDECEIETFVLATWPEIAQTKK